MCYFGRSNINNTLDKLLLLQFWTFAFGVFGFICRTTFRSLQPVQFSADFARFLCLKLIQGLGDRTVLPRASSFHRYLSEFNQTSIVDIRCSMKYRKSSVKPLGGLFNFEHYKGVLIRYWGLSQNQMTRIYEVASSQGGTLVY